MPALQKQEGIGCLTGRPNAMASMVTLPNVSPRP